MAVTTPFSSQLSSGCQVLAWVRSVQADRLVVVGLGGHIQPDIACRLTLGVHGKHFIGQLTVLRNHSLQRLCRFLGEVESPMPVDTAYPAEKPPEEPPPSPPPPVLPPWRLRDRRIPQGPYSPRPALAPIRNRLPIVHRELETLGCPGGGGDCQGMRTIRQRCGIQNSRHAVYLAGGDLKGHDYFFCCNRRCPPTFSSSVRLRAVPYSLTIAMGRSPFHR